MRWWWRRRQPAGAYDLISAYPGLDFPDALFAAGVPGDPRIVVAEQRGQVFAFDDDAATTTRRVVLNIGARLATGNEEGLLGFAFDPDFVQNRYVYVNYSLPAPLLPDPARSVIARMTWEASTDLIDPATEKILLEIVQPFTNHNGGVLAFGPDGYLYIGMGDGGAAGDPRNLAQYKTSLLGKVLRIDVHPADPDDPYDVPLDNPFVNEPGTRAEIYALGFRNPFRFSFDRQTGALWLGDVGQNTLEEIDLVHAGGNYGWRVYEGTQPFDDTDNTLPPSAFTPPVIEYGRTEGWSVIGGYVYRGARFASLLGRYLYADFGSGTIWALDWDGTQVLANDPIANAPNPTSFGEKNDGELLIVTRNSGVFELELAGGGGEIPTLLSQTGLFTDLVNLTPASGLIEYAPNQPFWSDGADKRRWVGVPDAAQIEFSSDDWTFPPGTIAVKHFDINLTQDDPSSARRLETRVLINTDRGWQGFTYRWNANQTDATLLAGRERETLSIATPGGSRDQLYEYPGRTDCLACHTAAAGFTLSLKTPQLKREFDYAGVIDNQLRVWNNIGLFDVNIGDPEQYEAFPGLEDAGASVEARARAYLDVNCSNCHQPSGTAPTDLDLRHTTATAETNAIGQWIDAL